jgi:hypothetical protein
MGEKILEKILKNVDGQKMTKTTEKCDVQNLHIGIPLV